MDIKEKALKIIDMLKKGYPDARCSLISGNALELLIATRLSAQCTDERVNKITEVLFKKFCSAENFANAQIEEIEKIVLPCGLYKTKARDIKSMCAMIIDTYGGKVPDTIDELVKLPGVGRKTANFIVGDVYGKPSYVVDTHCTRLCNRLGLVSTNDPYKIELALKKIIPPNESGDFCHRLVLHGRAVCKARNPQCEKCSLKDLCVYGNSETK